MSINGFGVIANKDKYDEEKDNQSHHGSAVAELVLLRDVAGTVGEI